jgi:hypothetical protein
MFASQIIVCLEYEERDWSIVAIVRDRFGQNLLVALTLGWRSVERIIEKE